ncbi:hypothetical protein EMIHUDRAFT_69270 [Emiliania huxleyi CCMP1516]|uniref:HORMA domain-containing protein n=2 Tax=Emiliania huxleyi TaxID=2903 RepID=A0A0D3HYF0_EMIH1|nr:hypothetical protein EMIHUDRAFT_69270 [Emiliania huxleyi CCMP1516]EOD04035.1 hypothetical protein EMIHUDRAFT_69270 [Emiliania huxleyi CCMP1516]|eukprot:XP_005756464.1 hypothetical protein EMIHUDRAFT_69270 [Emiliania huxleyi CCMP1516]
MSSATASSITLKGSVAIVTEFFNYSINSILYQRGIYPPETFRRVSKYGLTMLVTSDDALPPTASGYLDNVLTQLSSWLSDGTVQKLVVVVSAIATGETLERWVFDVHTDAGAGAEGGANKSEKEVMGEIQAAIMRQITASVTFLPLLDDACSFDLLVYTTDDVEVPRAWEESDPKHIATSDEVKLRSFTTRIHRVDACVSYKADA